MKLIIILVMVAAIEFAMIYVSYRKAMKKERRAA